MAERKLIHDPSELKLGKKRGVVKDPRTLLFADYSNRKKLLPQAPASVRHTFGITFRMFVNDRIGDCTIAAPANFDIAVSRGKVVLTDEQVIAAYSAVTGYNPKTGANDNGAYLLDVCNYWRSKGIGGRKILAFTSVNPQKWEQLRLANWLFGGVYIGLDLPVSAQRQATWDVPKGGTTGDGEPGSWGGHAVTIEDLTSDTAGTLVTWGEKKKFTRHFIEAYCSEAYAVISPDWLARHNGKTPQGFNEQQLMADLTEITGAH